MLIFFLLHFSTTQRLGNFRCVFLWTNTTFKGTYLCSRLISSTAVKHLSDVKAILILKSSKCFPVFGNKGLYLDISYISSTFHASPLNRPFCSWALSCQAFDLE